MQDINRKSYDKISNSWDEYRRRKNIDSCIVSFVKLLSSNAKVLDIGCGTGYPIAQYLSNQNLFVTGIDISEKMIEKAKGLNLNNSTFIYADFMLWDTNEQYDAIIAFDSLWHIPYQEQKKIYPKLAKMLKSNGCLLFTHGKVNGEITGAMFNEPFNYSALDSADLKKLLDNNNFQIISWTEDYQDKTSGTRDLLVVARKK